MLSFHVKFVPTDRRTDGRTNGRTDRRTTVKQYAPDLSIRGHRREKTLVVRLHGISQTQTLQIQNTFFTARSKIR